MDEKTKSILKHLLEMLDDRPEDMYDEEGMPTQELNELVFRLRKLVEEPVNVPHAD